MDIRPVFGLALLLSASCPAGAQKPADKTPPPLPPAAKTKADAPPTPKPGSADAALLDINDLGLLRALLPLKLTTAQIATLRDSVTPLKGLAEKRRKADDEALQALAADLAKAKADGLNSVDPPVELEKRVEAVIKEGETRAKETKNKALAILLPTLRETLTDAQKAIIEAQSEKFYGGKRIPPQYKAKPADAPKSAVQDLAMLFYIERVLLDERVGAILSALKPAKTDEAAPKP